MGSIGYSALMPRRHWLSLLRRVVRLLWSQPQRSAYLISDSYDRIAPEYDVAWTDHMRPVTLELLDRLGNVRGAEALDQPPGV